MKILWNYNITVTVGPFLLLKCRVIRKRNWASLTKIVKKDQDAFGDTENHVPAGDVQKD